MALRWLIMSVRCRISAHCYLTLWSEHCGRGSICNIPPCPLTRCPHRWPGGRQRSCSVTASSRCSARGWCSTVARSPWQPTTRCLRSVPPPHVALHVHFVFTRFHVLFCLLIWMRINQDDGCLHMCCTLTFEQCHHRLRMYIFHPLLRLVLPPTRMLNRQLHRHTCPGNTHLSYAAT